MKAFLVLSLCFLAVPAWAGEAEKVFEQVRGAVVTVTTLDEQNQVEGEGSGVILAPGRVVTNCHVVEDAMLIRVRSGEKELAATVLSGNLQRDLCLLEVKGLTTPGAQIRPSNGIQTGEAVYIVGNPLGFGLAVGNGLVSAVKQNGDEVQIYTSAPTSPGSSGGGLFDGQGRLVGITTARYLGAQNFNLALPAEWAGDLLKNGLPWQVAPKVDPDPNWIEKAQAFNQAGEWLKLEKWARGWGETWPTSAQADYYLGTALLNQKKPQEAIEALTAALQKDPQNAMVYGERATARRAMGDKAGGAEDLLRARSLLPSSGFLCRLQAIALKGDKDFDGALTATEEAVHRDPSDWQSWEFLGELHHQQRRYEAAEKAYRTALRLKPGEPNASANLAAVLAIQGKTEGARQMLAQGVPSDTSYAAGTWVNLGSAEEKKKHYAEAEKAYRKALEFNSESAEACQGLGNVLLATGRAREGEEALRESVRLKPALAGAWISLGVLLSSRGEKTEARDAYQKATSADPAMAYAWYALGVQQHELHAWGPAAAAFAEALRLDPSDAKTLGNLGDSLVRAGKVDEGFDALRKAEKMDPKSEVVLEGMAFYYGALRRDDLHALEYVERGLAVNPTGAIFWSSKGYALLRLKRFPEAVQALETGLRLQPDFSNAWINLGEALMRQGQIGKAIVALEKALELLPSATDARFFIIQCYANVRQFEKAQSHLDKLLQQAPQAAGAWSIQTALFLEQNKTKEALVAYQKLKSLNREMAGTMRAMYLSRGKQYELPE